MMWSCSLQQAIYLYSQINNKQLYNHQQVMNKSKTNQPTKVNNGTDVRRPRRCIKCSCVFAHDKYNEHVATCVRAEVQRAAFSRNKARSTMNSVLNKNNIRGPPTMQKRQQRKSLVYDNQSRFRIKNVSTYTQKNQAQKQQSGKSIYTEKRLGQDRKQIGEIKIQTKVQIQQNKSQHIHQQQRQNTRSPAQPASHNQQSSSILNNIQNYQVIQSENQSLIQPEPQPSHHRNQPRNNQPSQQRDSLIQPHHDNAQPNNQNHYDIQSLISNSNSIISFIRNINILGQDPTMNSMLQQLEQLNSIANQLSHMSSLGNQIGHSVGNLFGARIHQLQTVITNQIGIALIRNFNERLGSEFELLTHNRIEPQKTGFSASEIEQLFPEKINFTVRQCSICLQEMKRSQLVLQLQCNHIYHPDCIKQWLLSSKKCPLCRKVQSST